MKKILSLFGFSLFVLLTSCTLPTTLVKTDVAHPFSGSDRGWLVIPTHVTSEDEIYNKDACSLTVTLGLKKRDVNFEMLNASELKTPAKFSMVELPAGSYEIMEIFCGSAEGPLQFAGLANFRVFPGKISVLSGLHIHIDQKLMMTELRHSNVAEQTREVDLLLKQLVPDEKKLVVSAYTEVPLANQLGSQLLIPKALQRSPGFMKEIDRCYAKESKVNPLLIGAQRFDWTSEGASSLKMDRQQSLFTHEMKECLSQTLEKYIKANPGSAGTVWL